MASIQKRVTKDGRVRWTMRVFIGRDAATGKRKFIVKTFARKKDAEEEARRLEHLKDHNNLARPSKQPLSEYLTHWLNDVKAGRVRARTLEDYRRLIRRYVQEPPEALRPTGLPLGDLRMDRLRPEHFQELYSAMWRDLELSPRSIRYLHTVLRQALAHAVATRALPRNPTDHVKPPSRPQLSDAPGGGALQPSEKAVRAMNEEEVKRFLEAAREDRYFALWIVLLSGGLRPGEAFGLTWGDVDLESIRIRVRRALTRRAVAKICACGHLRDQHSSNGSGACQAKGCRSCTRYEGVKGWRLVEPKTDRARRSVLLPPVAVQALRAWRSKTAAERLQLGAEYAADDFVFCNEFGRPMEASNLYERNFRGVMEKAGLGGWEVRQGRGWISSGDASGESSEGKGTNRRFRPAFRVYDLRHTCATLLLKQGINPKVVSERLGHASITLTLDTYSHVLPDMQEGAAVALETALTGQG